MHWVGHSDSVRRRRIPSSKYRDMDTSAWRHGRMNKDLSSAQNPVPEIAQTSNKVQTSEGNTLAQIISSVPGITDAI